MKNKNNLFLFSAVFCLTFLSTNVYGIEGGEYDYSQNKDYSQQQGSTNVVPQCSSMDLKVFEEDDEIQTYKDHGYSRGDMRNLFSYRYDPKTEVSIAGNVAKIMRVRFPDDNSYLIAVVKTDAGDYLVNLGPVWYADENNFEVNEGDHISVKGSKIKTKGRYILIASEAKKDDHRLLLRTRTGSPQWGTPKAQKGGEQHYRPSMSMNRSQQDLNKSDGQKQDSRYESSSNRNVQPQYPSQY